VSFPREIHEVRVNDLAYIDLTDPGALNAVGLGEDDLVDPDWTACQRVGNAVQYLGIAGLLAPSATATGNVLAVFEPHVRSGQLTVVTSTRLDSRTP